MRRFQFDSNKFYHIYNRGIEKRDVFIDIEDFTRFIKSMREFNAIEPIGSLYEKDFRERMKGGREGVRHPRGIKETKSPIGDLVSSVSLNARKLVDVLSYCLIPNHYHFILEQLIEEGISKFMHKLNLGYSMYFNNKYNRSGSLFEGPFKAKEINNYSHFLKLIVYVNCNSEIHKICSAENWPWSSYLDYINKRNGTLCNKDIIKDEFANPAEFKNFCIEVLPDIIEIKELKGYLLE